MRTIGLPELIVILGVAFLSMGVPIALTLLGVQYLLSRQAKSVASRSCSRCGQRIPDIGAFCPLCGQRME
jgi:hypothetical protein